MGIAFGKEYVSSYVALTILTFGQLINAAIGSVGNLLNMTGHERDTMRAVAFAAAVNIVLNTVLIPSYSIEGATIATAITLTIWNLVLRRAVLRRLGIESMAFNPFISKMLQ